MRRDRAARVAERQRAYFNRALHELLVLPDGAGGWHDAPALDAWRARDRQKTVAAALVRPLPLSLSRIPSASPLSTRLLSSLHSPSPLLFFLCVAACQRPPLHTSHFSRANQHPLTSQVLCLNVGVDPPDVVKPEPCARLECWLDPASMPAQKALEAIGKALQAQYECERRISSLFII